uniref:Carbohydrate kinase PfkB domain-containing protein n=1 Tax=Meloidogyne enterolobii TaxID=390850 RepID=A0A6V7W585_MELEN|nr:unnamed protein product [Meloidogyne enterolobii]
MYARWHIFTSLSSPLPIFCVCIGSAIVDIEVISTEETKEPKKGEISYFPAEIKQRAGGVARNHAEALARLGIDVDLISAFGIDLNGDKDIGATFLFKKLEGLENLDFSHSLFTKECSTATSVSIESKKVSLSIYLSETNLRVFSKDLLMSKFC